MTFNYVTYSRHAFHDSTVSKGRFVASYAVNYLLGLAALWGASQFIPSPYLAGFVAVVVVSLINYFILRHWVFTVPKPGVNSVRGLLVERWFAVAVAIGLAYTLIFLWTNGYLPPPYFYEPSGTFMDYSAPATFAHHRGAYDTFATIYPPLSFLFLKLTSWGPCYSMDVNESARDCDCVRDRLAGDHLCDRCLPHLAHLPQARPGDRDPAHLRALRRLVDDLRAGARQRAAVHLHLPDPGLRTAGEVGATAVGVRGAGGQFQSLSGRHHLRPIAQAPLALVRGRLARQHHHLPHQLTRFMAKAARASSRAISPLMPAPSSRPACWNSGTRARSSRSALLLQGDTQFPVITALGSNTLAVAGGDRPRDHPRHYADHRRRRRRGMVAARRGADAPADPAEHRHCGDQQRGRGLHPDDPDLLHLLRTLARGSGDR